MSNIQMVLTACSDSVSAKALAKTLVEERLVACANILPTVTSLYRWKGSLEESSETAVLLKTEETLLAKLEERLHELHDYDCPEFLVVSVRSASELYGNWLSANLIPAS